MAVIHSIGSRIRILVSRIRFSSTKELTIVSPTISSPTPNYGGQCDAQAGTKVQYLRESLKIPQNVQMDSVLVTGPVNLSLNRST